MRGLHVATRVIVRAASDVADLTDIQLGIPLLLVRPPPSAESAELWVSADHSDVAGHERGNDVISGQALVRRLWRPLLQLELGIIRL